MNNIETLIKKQSNMTVKFIEVIYVNKYCNIYCLVLTPDHYPMISHGNTSIMNLYALDMLISCYENNTIHPKLMEDFHIMKDKLYKIRDLHNIL